MPFTAQDLIDDLEIRDLLYEDGPYLDVYLGEMEEVTSDDATTITTTETPRKVLSVWLKTDSDYEGTNYYADHSESSFTDNEITLDSALPSATTIVNVAYYTECETCGWDAARRRGRDMACATCGGAGMTLADGNAIEIPVQKVDGSGLQQKLGVTGEELLGSFIFLVKAEHENVLRAAKRLVFEDRDLEILKSKSGNMRIEPLYSFGVVTDIRIYMQYAKF